MWWPFGKAKKEEVAALPDDVRARLQRKCVITRRYCFTLNEAGILVLDFEAPPEQDMLCRAWESCVQANKEDSDGPCERLAIRHMECLTEIVAPEQAADFQKCTSRTGNRAVMHGSECSQEAAAMAQSLQKLQLYPLTIQPRQPKERRKRPVAPPPLETVA